MKQLGGIDASFLYMESPETPMHVAGFTLYDLPEVFEGSFYDHFREFFAGRVHLIPIFHKKLARTIFELDHPGWVDAGELDLDYHIQSATLPAPGTFRQAEELIAELHAVPLDRKRPLWQFTVIEGLQGGQVALYSKVHHAAIDGGAGMVITQALYDVTPVPRKVEPPKPKETGRPKPSTAERAILGVHDMATNVVRQQLNFMEAVPKTMGQIAEMLTPATVGSDVQLPQMIAPKTPFNATIGAKRAFAARSISLEEAKSVAKATGTKINDIVMAICGGALRRYLKDNNALPDAPLIAFVPISLREAGNTDLNNQVFGMSCPLATNYGDPLTRLNTIKKDSGTSKSMAGSVKNLALKDYTLVGAPMLLPGLMQLYGKSGLADILPQAVNVTISNTAGPPFPLYCAGAKVTALYPVSIPVHGIGLNLTVQSYLGKLDFGLTGDHAAIPDIDVLADHLETSFEELKTAVMANEVPKKKASKSSSKSAEK